MSNPRERRGEDAPTGTPTLAQATASGGMVAVVGVILLASWILKAEPRRADRSAPPSAPPPSPAATLAPIVDASPSPSPTLTPPPFAASEVARRALRDAERLAGESGGWTAQVAVLCSEESVAALLGKARGSDRLFLVPAELSGRSCLRVLWGTYPSAAAAAAADLPGPLRGKEKPRAVAIAGILP